MVIFYIYYVRIDIYNFAILNLFYDLKSRIVLCTVLLVAILIVKVPEISLF